MKTEDIVTHLEKFAPLKLQESWDNSGIQIKSHNNNINSIVLSLDITIDCVKFAIENNSNLIISHHPLFFSKMKNISIDSYSGKIVAECFQHKINIISLHTNVDAANGGLADYVAEKLNLKNLRILSPLKEKLFKIVTFVPEKEIEKFLNFFTQNNISVAGNYKACSFYTKGTGTFYPLNGAKPYLGDIDKLNKINEYRIEIIARENELNNVVKNIYEIHSYEEPLIDVYMLNNNLEQNGFGRIGELEMSMDFNYFLKFIKERLNLKSVRYVKVKDRDIKKIAVCPGSGMSLINNLEGKNIDVYLTGDVKYHDAFRVKEEKLFNLVDIGHFESEIFFVNLLSEKLKDLNIKINIFKQQEIFK